MSQTKIAWLICRALTKLILNLKKRNYFLADNKLLYCVFSPTNAHEDVGWGSVSQLAACCWWLSNSRPFTSSVDFFSYHPSNYFFFSHSFQAQVEVAMNVGAYHYDTLFDYYDELSDPEARKCLRFYCYYLKYTISQTLKNRNDRRFRKGHLTYPYLQYPWLPNGIQT